MNYDFEYSFENKEIYYFDKDGNKESIGKIKSVDSDFDQLDIEFSNLGNALYKNLSRPLDIADAIKVFKMNKKASDFTDMDSLLFEVEENAKNGLGNVLIGNMPKEITLNNVINNDKALVDCALNESLNKRNISFNAVELFKDGIDTMGRHVFVKTSNSEEQKDMLYMEYEALMVLKKNGINVPDVELKVIDDRPFLIMERFDKKGSFEVRQSSDSFLTKSDSGVYNSSQLFTISELVSNNSNPTSKANLEDKLVDKSYLIALSFLNKLNESKDEGTREFLDIANKKDKREIFKVLSFNLMIGNNDMHGENIGFLLNSKQNQLNGKIDYKMAPFYDITPHRFYTDEKSEFGNSPNGLELKDLVDSPYRGLLENKDFVKSFNEAKEMFNDYKISLDKRFENKSEQLNDIKKYFSKKY